MRRSRALGAAAALAAAFTVVAAAPARFYLHTELNERLPVSFYPAAGAGAGPAGGVAAGPPGEAAAAPLPVIYFSGEWGWTQILDETAGYLAAAGYPVLAIDSMTYFVERAGEPALASDLETFRSALNQRAGRPKEGPVLVVGYGWGAGMVPYLLNRARSSAVRGALLVAPGETGAVLFRTALQLKLPIAENESFSVGYELRRMTPIPVVVLEGGKDNTAAGRALQAQIRGPHRYVPIPAADHQFHDNRPIYLKEVVESIRWLETQRPGPGGPDLSRPGAGPGTAPVVGPSIGGVVPRPAPTPPDARTGPP